ncbi:hypothetical protein NBRC110019_18460 [Neptunitalea chrysea]|uniref:DUF4136 domain-containing protein n=1 Tax=Neptunitalea chrysea TaxID=1647581 RepID=A0A9W6EVE1_9FLAO|nr:DUF4136 domain-containing protein [Neptunitalea chrysea]GLB52806.1 hypothetical protein NBRC110019_18460 [Neptunitalea chrysea]
MKFIKTILVVAIIAVTASCSSVRVVSDYDKEADFTTYKTFAFYKPGIDKAEVSDLDKKRILRAIEKELTAKGFVKSNNPELLVNIFTKEQKQVDVYNNYGYYGWGWNPWYWGGNYNNVRTSTQGSLFIDLIDAGSKELIWQGKGTGYLITDNIDKKDERIGTFVHEILEQYPPEIKN